MSELNEMWEQAIADAAMRARSQGRGDVAAYLALRASNDRARAAGIEWLVTTFQTLAGEANRVGAGVQIQNEDSHRFQVANSTMVGSLLTLRTGVRAIFVEAGWPRVPRDGIVKGGGLASGNIRHFGDRASNDEILLVKPSSEGAPRWIVVDDEGARSALLESRVRQHISRLIRDR